MKRMRLLMMMSVLTVVTAGVQIVHAACPSTMTLYYEGARMDCEITARNSDYSCDYTCRVTRIYFT
jgi:hypothetical protein